MNDSDPLDETRIVCDRTAFLQEMFEDEERGALQDEAHYIAKYPPLEAFVKAEYAALHADLAGESAGPSRTQCGRYRVVREMARGGMGAIYEAVDPELKRRCVLKMLHAAVAMDSAARERFRREAQVLGGLDHPSLVSITDVVEERGELALVMPYFEGAALAEHIAMARTRRSVEGAGAWVHLHESRKDRADCLRDVLRYFCQAAEGLQAAHDAGIVHRDIKPDNLLVTDTGSAVVVDFGLARMLDEERVTSPGELLGTPLYMSPESIEGELVDARSDVYALGLSLYEVLTLEHPFAGADNRAATFQKILAGNVVDARSLQPLLSRDLSAVVMHAIERSPCDRYATAEQFAADLRRLLDLEPTQARPVSGVTVAWRRVRRRPQLPVLLTLLVIVLCAFATVWAKYSETLAVIGDGVAKIEGGDRDGGVKLLKKELRALPAAALVRGILQVHPSGPSPVFRQFAWLGNANRAAPDGEGMQHRYRVRMLADGEEVWRGECLQPTDSLWCELPAPDLTVDYGDGREWSWRVDWLGDGGADPEQVAALLRDHPDGRRMLSATCKFQCVELSDAVIEVMRRATTFDELEELTRSGYASFALFRLSELDERADSRLSKHERLTVQLHAAQKLGAHHLERAAASALAGLPEKR